MEERILTGDELKEDITEAGIRPDTLADYVGQSEVKENLDIFIKAAADVEKMQAGVVEAFPLSFTDICNVIRFALRQHHAKLTDGQVLQLIDDYLEEEHSLNDLMEITMNLMQRFF